MFYYLCFPPNIAGRSREMGVPLRSANNRGYAVKKCSHCRNLRPLDLYVGKGGKETKVCADCRAKTSALMHRTYHARVKAGWKICPQCRRQKPPREFELKAGGKDRLCSLCRKKPHPPRTKIETKYTLYKEYQIPGCPWERGNIKQHPFGCMM